MKLISTRDITNSLTPLEAVLKGIASDGGLYVPAYFPKIDNSFLESLLPLSYPQLASRVMGQYFDIENLEELLTEAYSSFDTKEVAPLHKLTDSNFVMELWHGPTLAFKDMALQVLPRLMSCARPYAGGKDILILTATSGDTGKAALDGFADVEGTKIVVFFPDEGVSDMQKLQMVTQKGDNTFVCSVKGNFDDAQTGVKKLFASEAFAKAAENYRLSSANSINFGRLAPQIAYYFHAYIELARKNVIRIGDKVNFTVPTGNFGNILAAYYAREMGLPVGKLICASNKNDVLTEFFATGGYNARREFFKTTSPSMDILISSNLERLLFEICGRDDKKVASLMRELSEDGAYQITKEMQEGLSVFAAGSADDEKALSTIKNVFNKYGYLIDTHTAVAEAVYENYAVYGDKTPNVVVSTASPYKFVSDVLYAVTGERVEEPFTAAKMLSEKTGTALPKQISALETAEIIHKNTSEKEKLAEAVLGFI